MKQKALHEYEGLNNGLLREKDYSLLIYTQFASKPFFFRLALNLISGITYFQRGECLQFPK